MILESFGDLISDTAYVLTHPSMKNLKAYALSHPVACTAIPAGTLLTGGCASTGEFTLNDVLPVASRIDAEQTLLNPQPYWEKTLVSPDGKRTYHLKLQGKDCLLIYATPGSEFGLKGKFGLEYWDEEPFIFQEGNNLQKDVVEPVEYRESSYKRKKLFIKRFNKDLEDIRKENGLARN